MDEMKLAKFETMIEDINKKIDKYTAEQFPETFSNIRRRERVKLNMALTLIFNYDSCNDYSKIIIQKSKLLITEESDRLTDIWEAKYPDFGALNSSKAKIRAAKLFVEYCGERQNVEEGYKFIFWSLMILTVDKYNADEYLSIICDFAKMLGITDGEFEDIIYAVKYIFEVVDKGYKFKSVSVMDIFQKILNFKMVVATAPKMTQNSVISSINKIFGL